MLSGLFRSPAACCTLGGHSRGLSFLVSARTGWPAPASARTSSPPTLPVAPVTRIIRPPRVCRFRDHRRDRVLVRSAQKSPAQRGPDRLAGPYRRRIALRRELLAHVRREAHGGGPDQVRLDVP